MSAPLVIELRGTAQAGQTQTYTHLPFELPPGVARIDVTYHYSDAVGSDPRLTDGNTVDIGIFDPRGHAFMGAGFRGWSGSARSGFFLSASEATPGYLPGPLPAGTWHICLGLYKIAPQGCTYHVVITLTLAEDDTRMPAPPVLLPLETAARPERQRNDGWYCGELHCHTVHSDGDSDPLEVVRRAEALGLDFLAITDHNVLSHLARLREGDTPLLLIPGVEVTTYKGHWNAWGALAGQAAWLDFRITDAAQMAQVVAAANAGGLLTSCNHPRPYGPEWAYPQVDDFACIEVWNGEWALFNEVALNYWEARLRQGRRITAVGGSDCHFHQREHIARLARPSLWVQLDDTPSPARILDAVRAGRVAISAYPSGPRVTLDAGTARMGDAVAAQAAVTVTARLTRAAGCTLEWVTDAGVIDMVQIDRNADHALTCTLDARGLRYLRAQLVQVETTARLVCALTNPLYFAESHNTV